MFCSRDCCVFCSFPSMYTCGVDYHRCKHCMCSCVYVTWCAFCSWPSRYRCGAKAVWVVLEGDPDHIWTFRAYGQCVHGPDARPPYQHSSIRKLMEDITGVKLKGASATQCLTHLFMVLQTWAGVWSGLGQPASTSRQSRRCMVYLMRMFRRLKKQELFADPRERILNVTTCCFDCRYQTLPLRTSFERHGGISQPCVGCL